MGETSSAPRFAAGHQAQLQHDGSPWENPSAHSTADMIVSPPATAYLRPIRFGTPLVRPSSAGSSRGGSSAGGGSFRAQRGDASPPTFNIPLTTTHTQKQRWPDSHGAQTLRAWLQRTSSSGSGSGSEGKAAQDHGALQRCASAPHERNGGGVNSDGAPRGGGGEAREIAAALQSGGGGSGMQQETEEERSIKRRLLNREYAKRSRQRQHERFVELEAQVNSMAAEKRAADQRLQEMEQALMILQEENARLRQIAAGRYNRDMAEILRAIQQAGGFPAEAAAGLSAAGGFPPGGFAAPVEPPQTGFAPDARGARGFLEEGASAPASGSAAAAAAAAARVDLRFNAAGAFPGASSYQGIELAGTDTETAIGGNWPRSASAPAPEHVSGGAHAPQAPGRGRGTFPLPPPALASSACLGFGAADVDISLGADEDTAALLAVAGLVGGNGGSGERVRLGGAKEGAELGNGMEDVGGVGGGGGGEGGERVEGSSCGAVGGGAGEWNEHEGTLFAMIHHLHKQL
ncbi:unnamed protein product [Closterium sp. NIES-65]|nr:unnamed protein product [Closterium sp. NIES-65]